MIHIDPISTAIRRKNPNPWAWAEAQPGGSLGAMASDLKTPTGHWARPADETSKTGTFL